MLKGLFKFDNEDILIFLLIILSLFSFLACSSSKSSLKKENVQIASLEYENLISSLKREVVVYKDSLKLIQALKERSIYEGTDTISTLETTYAISTAKISNGKLYHEIKNKDSIPTLVTEIIKENFESKESKTDSTYSEIKQDKEINEKVITKKDYKSIWCFGLITFLLLVLTIKLYYKQKK